MLVTKGYSFDDLLLVPKLTNFESRGEANIRTKVADLGLNLPIFSAPMDTVTEENMAIFMWENGGAGIIHRYNTVSQQYAMVKWVKSMGARVAAAVGINGDTKERVDALVEAGVDLICIDIAHGHMTQALKMVETIKSSHKVNVMSGNIVTGDAAFAYIDAGADVLRVGVGPGSACSTRLVAGVGYPQLSAIANIYDELVEDGILGIKIVSDGGIRTSGDVVKALAAGADAVIVGGILAPFDVAAGKRYTVRKMQESPVNELFSPRQKDPSAIKAFAPGIPQKIDQFVTMKQYRGMASEDALAERGKEQFLVEGESFMVPVRYDHKEFIGAFRDGIQAGFAYLGARNIQELRENAVFVEVTSNGYREGTPHFKEVN